MKRILCSVMAVPLLSVVACVDVPDDDDDAALSSTSQAVVWDDHCNIALLEPNPGPTKPPRGSVVGAPTPEIAPSKVPGRMATQVTVEIPISVDAGDGVSAADLIACTVTPSGWYAGSGHNIANGVVWCPVVEDSIAITFQWYSHNTRALMRVAGPAPCFEKSTCAKSDGFDSYAVLDVAVCATVVKAGKAGSGCAWVGPF